MLLLLMLSFMAGTILCSIAVSEALRSPTDEHRAIGLDPARHTACDYPKCRACCVPPFATEAEFIVCPRCPACQAWRAWTNLSR